jgi:hypothetical protein
MKTFIRFENSRQVETVALENKPAGENWKTAPKNFDFSKRYKLSGAGAIEEIPIEELAAERLKTEKALALQELSRLVDNARDKYVGRSPAKRKCYAIQEMAANAVIDNIESVLGLLIKPLATLRNIGLLEMAELILTKSAASNRKIIEAEAIEDEYKMLIEGAESVGNLRFLITEVLNKLEDF